MKKYTECKNARWMDLGFGPTLVCDAHGKPGKVGGFKIFPHNRKSCNRCRKFMSIE